MQENLRAVATGMRPAWLCSPGEALRADVEAAAARLNLCVSPDLFAVDDGLLGFLVTRRPCTLPRGGLVTHGWVGRKLGIPCSNDAPWARKAESCYAVLGWNPVGVGPSVRAARGGTSWRVSCVGMLTTFWCTDENAANAWWDALSAKPATRRFREKVLAPQGHDLFFVVLTR